MYADAAISDVSVDSETSEPVYETLTRLKLSKVFESELGSADLQTHEMFSTLQSGDSEGPSSSLSDSVGIADDVVHALADKVSRLVMRLAEGERLLAAAGAAAPKYVPSQPLLTPGASFFPPARSTSTQNISGNMGVQEVGNPDSVQSHVLTPADSSSSSSPSTCIGRPVPSTSAAVSRPYASSETPVVHSSVIHPLQDHPQHPLPDATSALSYPSARDGKNALGCYSLLIEFLLKVFEEKFTKLRSNEAAVDGELRPAEGVEITPGCESSLPMPGDKENGLGGTKASPTCFGRLGNNIDRSDPSLASSPRAVKEAESSGRTVDNTACESKTPFKSINTSEHESSAVGLMVDTDIKRVGSNVESLSGSRVGVRTGAETPDPGGGVTANEKHTSSSRNKVDTKNYDVVLENEVVVCVDTERPSFNSPKDGGVRCSACAGASPKVRVSDKCLTNNETDMPNRLSSGDNQGLEHVGSEPAAEATSGSIVGSSGVGARSGTGVSIGGRIPTDILKCLICKTIVEESAESVDTKSNSRKVILRHIMQKLLGTFLRCLVLLATFVQAG